MNMTRAQIQDQIRIFVKTMTTKVEVETAMHDWLEGKTIPDLDKQQIMNDLPGYSEYNNLT
jgi:hypothetical protein